MMFVVMFRFLNNWFYWAQLDRRWLVYFLLGYRIFFYKLRLNWLCISVVVRSRRSLNFRPWRRFWWWPDNVDIHDIKYLSLMRLISRSLILLMSKFLPLGNKLLFEPLSNLILLGLVAEDRSSFVSVSQFVSQLQVHLYNIGNIVLLFIIKDGRVPLLVDILCFKPVVSRSQINIWERNIAELIFLVWWCYDWKLACPFFLKCGRKTILGIVITIIIIRTYYILHNLLAFGWFNEINNKLRFLTVNHVLSRLIIFQIPLFRWWLVPFKILWTSLHSDYPSLKFYYNKVSQLTSKI